MEELKREHSKQMEEQEKKNNEKIETLKKELEIKSSQEIETLKKELNTMSLKVQESKLRKPEEVEEENSRI